MWAPAHDESDLSGSAVSFGEDSSWLVPPSAGSFLGGYAGRQAGVLSSKPAQGGDVVGVRPMDDAALRVDPIYEERMRRASFLQAKAITQAAQQSNPRGLPLSGVVMESFPGADPEGASFQNSTHPSTGQKLLNPAWEHVLRYGYRGVHPDNSAVLAQDVQARSRDHLLVPPLTARDRLMSMVLRATSSPGQTYSPHMKPLGRRVAEYTDSPYFAENQLSHVESDYVFTTQKSS